MVLKIQSLLMNGIYYPITMPSLLQEVTTGNP